LVPPDFDEAVFEEAVFDEVVLSEPDFGKTDLDLDNTDVARDHSFHCIADPESGCPRTILGMWG
jgi:hypothetical protein